MKPKKKPKLEPIASATLGDKSTYHFYEVDNVTLKMVDTTNSRRQILISKVCLQGLIAAFADLDEKYPF